MNALAAAARGRRLDLGLSQSDLARKARVSRQWISEFEAGKPSAEVGLAMRVFDALGTRLALEIPPAATDPATEADPESASDSPIDLDIHLERIRTQ